MQPLMWLYNFYIPPLRFFLGGCSELISCVILSDSEESLYIIAMPNVRRGHAGILRAAHFSIFDDASSTQ